MKQKDRKELHHKSVEELSKMLVETRKQLTDARFEHFRGKLKNASYLSTLRRQIAQILTIIREKDLLAAKTELGGQK